MKSIFGMRTIDYLMERNRVGWVRMLIGILILFLLFISYRVCTVDDLADIFNFDKKFVDVVAYFAISVVASVVASFVFIQFYRQERDHLDSIRKLTSANFLNAFLNDLRHFEGRICQDYNVNVTLKESEKLLLCTIQYDYKKTFLSRHLRFKLTRIRSESDYRTQPNHDSEFFSHESYFSLDERQLKIIPDNEVYSFKTLVVGNQNHIQLELVENSNSLFIEYSAEIPEAVELDGLVQISYEVSFPIEMESQLSLNCELPTKGFRVKLDYHTIAQLIQVSGSTFVSARHGPTPIGDDPKKPVIDFAYPGWLLPKNGIIFVWWKQ